MSVPNQPSTASATIGGAAFAGRIRQLRSNLRRHPTAVTVTGSLLVAGGLGFGRWGKRGDFGAALGLAPLWILAAAMALHIVWLIARSEAWHVCVGAAGGQVSRRRLYRAASLGYLGNTFNGSSGSRCESRPCAVPRPGRARILRS